MSELTSEQRQEIIAAVQSGCKIEAIKLYRDASGADLRDAKDFIEKLEITIQTGTVSNSQTDELRGQIVALLKENQKIPAIKMYCDATGARLKEGKDAVEAIGRENGIEPVKGAGCGSSVLLLAAVVFGILAV